MKRGPLNSDTPHSPAGSGFNFPTAKRARGTEMTGEGLEEGDANDEDGEEEGDEEGEESKAESA